MAYTLRVLFSGLCAFVPNKPFDQLNDPPTEVTVLLQNLLRPKPLTLSLPTAGPIDEEIEESVTAASDDGSNGSNFLEPHFPVLELDLCDVHPQSLRKPDLRREETGKGGCFLFGEEISFDLNLKKGQKRRLRIPDDPTFHPRGQQAEETRFDKESLYWLARLDKASPGNFVDPELLTEPLSLVGNPPILTRLKLTHGFLRVSKLSDKVCEFHPPDPQRPYRQKIATELALDIEGITGPVVIVGRDPNGVEKRLTLTPVKSPGLVEIRIQNRELDSLLGIPNLLMPPDEKPDFEVFYSLIAKGGATAQNIVRRFPKQPAIGEDGGSLKNPSLCPPTALAVKSATAA
ncbi:MAG TPA: hypothetical protein VF179_28260 [Thermoanaerobaculia bacterium]|nr:hypothetical protein [Thermoanaerobaculia bacterium]